MTTRIFTIISFIAAGFCACKTENRQITADMINFPQSGSADADADLPMIKFDSSEVDFGTLAIGEKFVHTFRFINAGESPLVISQVTPSCGCTTPKDWPREPIEHGEAGQITVEFNSKGFPGQIEKSVSVLTNCIPKVWELKIKGEVRGVESEPAPGSGFEMEMQ